MIQDAEVKVFLIILLILFIGSFFNTPLLALFSFTFGMFLAKMNKRF